ncbi:hypothetical protein, partial [Nocardia sp. NPDC003648]
MPLGVALVVRMPSSTSLRSRSARMLRAIPRRCRNSVNEPGQCQGDGEHGESGDHRGAAEHRRAEGDDERR